MSWLILFFACFCESPNFTVTKKLFLIHFLGASKCALCFFPYSQYNLCDSCYIYNRICFCYIVDCSIELFEYYMKKSRKKGVKDRLILCILRVFVILDSRMFHNSFCDVFCDVSFLHFKIKKQVTHLFYLSLHLGRL